MDKSKLTIEGPGERKSVLQKFFNLERKVKKLEARIAMEFGSDPLMDGEELAKVLRCTIETIDDWRRSKVIPAYCVKTIKRKSYFIRPQIHRWLCES